MKNAASISLAALIVATGSLVGLDARAQSGERSDALLEEIIVTARKREESLQDVPLSIDVFDEEFIAESGVNGIFELAQFTPNLSFRQSYGRTFDRPSIRGQSVILGANTVGLFVDGVFVAGSLSSTPLDNVQRVEVIKGPQAALFGRATLAGAINYITKRPSTEDFEGSVTVRGAEHDEYEARFYTSGPLGSSNNLAFTFGGRHYEYGGEYENVGPGGGTLGSEKSKSWYGSLYFAPSDNFDAFFKTNWSKDGDGHPTNMLVIEDFDLNCFPDSPRGYYCGVVPNPGVMEIDNNEGVNYGIDRETLRTSLELNWSFNDYTLTSLTGWSKEDEDWLIDLGSEANELPFLRGATTAINSEQEYWSQEFRLASPVDESLRWLVGAYFYDEEDFDPVDEITDQVENRALFGLVEYDFTDRLTGTAELRWAEDDITDVTDSGLVLDDTFSSTTPRVTLDWAQSDDATIYGSIAKGTKPGGFNAALLGSDIPQNERDRLSRFLTFDEEEAWNFEIGTKRTLMDGRVNMTLAAFFIDWDQQQLTSAEPLIDVNGEPVSIPFVTNIGKSEIKGLELSVFAALTERLDLTFAYGYTDSEIKEQCDSEYGSLIGPQPGVCDQINFPGGASVAGNRTPNAPENTASLSLEYQQPFRAGMDWFIRGDFLYEDSRFAQVFNFAETGSSSIVNLRTGFEAQDWKVSLWVKNLTDEDAVNSVIRLIDFDSLPRAFIGLPTLRGFQAHLPRGRQVGVTFDYHFGR